MAALIRWHTGVFLPWGIALLFVPVIKAGNGELCVCLCDRRKRRARSDGALGIISVLRSSVICTIRLMCRVSQAHIHQAKHECQPWIKVTVCHTHWSLVSSFLLSTVYSSSSSSVCETENGPKIMPDSNLKIKLVMAPTTASFNSRDAAPSSGDKGVLEN